MICSSKLPSSLSLSLCLSRTLISRSLSFFPSFYSFDPCSFRRGAGGAGYLEEVGAAIRAAIDRAPHIGEFFCLGEKIRAL